MSLLRVLRWPRESVGPLPALILHQGQQPLSAFPWAPGRGHSHVHAIHAKIKEEGPSMSTPTRLSEREDHAGRGGLSEQEAPTDRARLGHCPQARPAVPRAPENRRTERERRIEREQNPFQSLNLWRR